MSDRILGVLAFPDAEELDFVGPWEVFTMACALAPDRAGAPRVRLLAPQAEPVRCAKGLRVLPDHAVEQAPPLELLLVPGGIGTRRLAEDEALLSWLAAAAGPCRWVSSVCTGSLLLHAAGLTDGCRITTHHAFVAALRERVADTATVLDDVRFVRDGRIVTAAGVSAGIDMALWLVGQLWSPAHARATQRAMQYDPAPPYSAEV